MTDQARAECLERERLGVIVMPTGKELRVRNVSHEHFRRIVAKHDERFGRSGSVAANTFQR